MFNVLGLCSYTRAWELQEFSRAELLQDLTREGTVYLTEHPPTFTLGRGEDGTSFLKAREWYTSHGFEIIDTNRGGKLTYHGPGQLVVYPVIYLTRYKIGVKQFVSKLEDVMIALCKEWGVIAARKEGFPGVWVNEKKIGSIGIHVRKHVSIHGFALNINPNLDHFSMISPCGLGQIAMTSIAQELGMPVNSQDAINPAKRAFNAHFLVSNEHQDI